jgi:putative membrane protein
MSVSKKLLQRGWRPLLFVAWIWALTGLLGNQRYLAFLRPEFGIVLGLGTLTLLGFLVTGLTEARSHRFGIPQVLQMLILLMPLAYLWNAQGAFLDAFAFQNRSLGLPSLEAPGADSTPGPGAVERTANGESEAPQTASDDPAEVEEVTILGLYYAPRLYENKRVKLIGMVHNNYPQVKQDFGKSMPVVFRFVINCCAADAIPVAVVVDGQDLPVLPDSSWVEVEGIFTMLEKNGRRVPMLEKSSLKKTQTPRQRYLFY